MPKRKRPRCFVAMAFGRSDTDELYNKVIVPLLAKNDVKPIRVDKQQSNEYVNLQIMKLLGSCDFCIADLTYSRPSVYFEAGYAERQIEVIYTVRKDHLKQAQTDEALRVHFDLAQKPLIDWRNPQDSTFSQRLERRLRGTALSKWRRAQRADEKLAKARATFAAMPTYDRLAALRRRAILSLRKVHFCQWIIQPPPGGSDSPQYGHVYKDPSRHSRLDSIFIAARELDDIYQSVSLQALDSLTQRAFRDYKWARGAIGRPGGSLDPLKGEAENTLRSCQKHTLFLTLRSTPKTRIEKIIPAHHIREADYLAYAQTTSMSHGIDKPKTPAEEVLHFSPGLDSISAADSFLERFIRQVEGCN